MTPLLRVTLAFLGGLVPGLLVADAPAIAALCGALGVAGAIALAHGAAERGRTLTIALLSFALLGAGAGSGAAHAARTDCRALWRDGERLRLHAVPASLAVEGRAVPFLLRDAHCGGAVRVLLPRDASAPPGEGVLLVGRWRRFDAPTRWPVDPARSGSLRADSVQALPPGTVPPLWSVALRARAQGVLRAVLPQTHGVAEALLLAQRDALDPGVRDAFVAAGLAHLLAISGAHVGMLAAMLLLAFRLLRLPLLPGRLGVLLAIGVYVLLLGAPAAATRAALQLGLLLAALLAQRPTDGWNTAAAAALLLLVLNPLAALDPGFQLSFAGVGGLLAYRRPLAGALPERLPKGVRDALAASIAATLVTAPIAALHFGQIAPIGILAGLVATPLVALALPSLACALALHPLAPALTAWLGPGTELLLRALVEVARIAASVPAGHGRVPASTLLLWLLAAAAFVVLNRRASAAPAADAETPATAARARRQRRLRQATIAGVLAALIAWLPAFSPAGALELHAIDVGQGDAIAIRTPRGRWLLVDAGMRSQRWDAGRSRVVPYLLRAGVRRIDLLVLTHAHADHIGGARAVFEAFDVATVIDPGAPARSGQYLETLDAARAEPARWVWPRPGSELVLDGVRLRFLYPRARLLDAPADPNDFSVAFHLGFGRFGALFLGDAPAAVEAELVAEHGRGLAAPVLKVGHHGSATSTSETLLAMVEPDVAVLSLGRDNRYGHPAPAVVARLLRHGARVVRTDERGSIVIRGWRSGELELATQR
ncbi:MAG TPA: DNA internalization-related competence protein ComEC/Rec2 [Longimicrobiales bacterium]|nr:DNA internalization-related competence protein ComEC/Rec2 [Longimicrobiales bacterium]